MPSKTCKLHVGGKKYTVRLTTSTRGLAIITNRAYKELNDEIKCLEGARWNRGARMWEFKNSFRNHFALRALMNPKEAFGQWDEWPELPEGFDWGERRDKGKIVPVTPYKHQVEMARHVMRQRAVIVGQVGVGKTLPVMRVMEWLRARYPDEKMFYVAPRSGMISIRREMHSFLCDVGAELMTYEGLKKRLRTWTEADGNPPIMLVLDESSRVKSFKAQRSKSALYLSTQMLVHWQGSEFVVEMTGTPSPKDPVDWWMQCEIAQPGFLREGNIYQFRDRLGVWEKVDGDFGSYPKLVQWKDGSACLSCGAFKDELDDLATFGGDDDWVHEQIADYKSRIERCKPCGGTGVVPDEITLLGKRMKGLVEVWDKDVLDLPKQIFKRLYCKPPQSLLNAADALARTSGSTIEALNRLRQLSDGFLYDEDTKVPEFGPTGKDDLLLELLEQYRDVGRGVIYAAYHASVDRVVGLCERAGWNVWKMDGRGVSTWDGRNSDEAYAHFQDGDGGDEDPVVFVAHPKSGGMALTLTRSPWLCFYSNDFDGESREQGEGRIHRPGMDVNKGATVYDLINLPVDELVVENLTNKRRLQSIPMNEILACLSQKSE